MTWNDILQREMSRIERADFFREVAEIERATRRAEAARKQRVAAVRHSAELVLADMSEAAVMAAAPREAKAARAMEEAARDMGVTADELAAAIAVEKSLLESKPKTGHGLTEVGMQAGLGLAGLAAVADWTAAGLQSTAAKVGRDVLRTVGPTAAVVVCTAAEATAVTVAEVHKVPDLTAAEARAEAARTAYAKAAAKLAEAETKVKAAEATKAVRPIREANREADRVAAGLAKVAARMARAEAALEAAKAAADVAEAAGLITVPVGTFPAATAARDAADLELPKRTDVMPVGYVHSGPEARHTVKPVSDPTGSTAAGLADGLLITLAELNRRELALEAAAKAAKDSALDKGGRPESTEAERAEYKARRALAAKARRRNAKLRNK